MTIGNFIGEFPVKWVDIYNYDRGKFIFNGPYDKLPEDYKRQEVVGVNLSKKGMRINIDHWR